MCTLLHGNTHKNKMFCFVIHCVSALFIHSFRWIGRVKSELCFVFWFEVMFQCFHSQTMRKCTKFAFIASKWAVCWYKGDKSKWKIPRWRDQSKSTICAAIVTNVFCHVSVHVFAFRTQLTKTTIVLLHFSLHFTKYDQPMQIHMENANIINNWHVL